MIDRAGELLLRASKYKIDKVGEKIRSGGLDTEALVFLSDYRNSFAYSYRFVEEVIRGRLSLDVSGRPAKSTTAIVEKLQRESIRLSQIQDIAGCRIVINGLHTQNRVISDLEVLLENVRVIDRRVNPSHGYRAVHLITTTRGLPVEVQIRTRLQHTWADLSEKLADKYGQEIKYGQGNASVISLLSDFSREIERLERIRYDRNLVSRGHPVRYFTSAKEISQSRLRKDLERLDRESMYRTRLILSREIEV